jgi:hypothetical protein
VNNQTHGHFRHLNRDADKGEHTLADKEKEPPSPPNEPVKQELIRPKGPENRLVKGSQDGLFKKLS